MERLSGRPHSDAAIPISLGDYLLHTGDRVHRSTYVLYTHIHNSTIYTIDQHCTQNVPNKETMTTSFTRKIITIMKNFLNANPFNWFVYYAQET